MTIERRKEKKAARRLASLCVSWISGAFSSALYLVGTGAVPQRSQIGDEPVARPMWSQWSPRINGIRRICVPMPVDLVARDVTPGEI